MSASASVIGIDLGGTHLRAARIDATGRRLAVARIATDRFGGPDAVAAQIDHLVGTLRDATTTAIGIGIPGAVEVGAGIVLGIPALAGWDLYPLAARLAEASGLPCRLENDAKAAALGEWRAGAGKDCRHFAYVTVGTGIGGGIIVDGRLLRGAGGLAGEIGHTRVTETGEPCACGRIGCWQAVASGTALGLRAQRALATMPGSLVETLAGGEAPTAMHVAQAGRRADPLALALLAELARWLGIGFANVQHCYAPERIVMGGGIAALLDLLQSGIEASQRAGLLPGFRPAEIRAAALGDDAGLVGAAMVAMGEPPAA